MRIVKDARDRLEWGPPGPPPLLVKIAPDLTEADKVGAPPGGALFLSSISSM